MNKIVTLPFMVFSMLGIVGCVDSESIPSEDLYTTISEKKMPYYCKREVAKKLGIYTGDIYLYPLEYHRGAKIIYGRYSVDSNNLKEFACLFNADDTYAGIKMQHSHVRNTVCNKDN